MQVTIYHGHTFPEAQGVCVVIDVLRAFTTAAFAFGNGAREIIFVSSLQEAYDLHRGDPSLLLMGEKDGFKIEGFHHCNSPIEMARAKLQGKKMVQRTSSGTQGIVGVSHATHMFAAGFVTAEATIQRIIDLNPSHVSLIATGKRNGDEDLALAEYMKAKLEKREISLEPLLHRVRTSPCAQRLIGGDVAYTEAPVDIALATAVNHFPFAIEVFKENGLLIGRPSRQN